MSKDEFRDAVAVRATTILWAVDLDWASEMACHLWYAPSGEAWLGLVVQHIDKGAFVLDLKPQGAP